jgi:hypothetical protein
MFAHITFLFGNITTVCAEIKFQFGNITTLCLSVTFQLRHTPTMCMHNPFQLRHITTRPGTGIMRCMPATSRLRNRFAATMRMEHERCGWSLCVPGVLSRPTSSCVPSILQFTSAFRFLISDFSIYVCVFGRLPAPFYWPQKGAKDAKLKSACGIRQLNGASFGFPSPPQSCCPSGDVRFANCGPRLLLLPESAPRIHFNFLNFSFSFYFDAGQKNNLA